MDIFYHDDDRHEYLHLLQTQSERFGLESISYCLMTNHVHLIAIPTEPESLARAIGEAHRLYTRMINFRKNVRGYLFQGRFSSCPVQTGLYLHAAVRYVERNPVKAKMVSKPWEYQWSSAAFHSGMVNTDPLVTDSPLLADITNWQDFLGVDSDLFDEIKQKSRTGRPCGTDAFFDTVEKITGRNLRPKPAGRPSN
ncbi:MAG: transposase [Proteobacteria bacterium]|nr:transposase [Pseudomonadota bacterium]MBU1641144.1 transposase [Pseudomonadota bacterium]